MMISQGAEDVTGVYTEPNYLLVKLNDECMSTIITRIENLEKMINSVIKYMR